MTRNWLPEPLRQPFPVDLWTTLRVAHNPQAQPPQKRSIDALQIPVNLTRQRHCLIDRLNAMRPAREVRPRRSSL